MALLIQEFGTLPRNEANHQRLSDYGESRGYPKHMKKDKGARFNDRGTKGSGSG